MPTPKFTDLDRYRQTYSNAEESRKPGYLAKKFARARQEQAKNAQEVADKVQALKRR